MAQSQLEIQAAINRAIQERTELLKEQQSIITGQLKILQQLQEGWEKVDPSDVTGSLGDMNRALEEAGITADDFGTRGQKMSRDISRGLLTTRGSLVKVETVLERLGRRGFANVAAAGLGFIDGFKSGLIFVQKSLAAVLDLTKSLAHAIVNVGAHIAAMPFRSLDGLVAAANKLGPLMEAIARATQEVVEHFGDISKGPGKAVIATAQDLGAAFESMGLGGFKVFGSLDERIQAVNQTAKALGNAFDSLQGEFKSSGAAIMLLQRGLGLTEDGTRGVALRAKAMGTAWQKQLSEMVKYSKALEKSTGFTAKGISRDMGEMIADVSHFGNLGPKELGMVSASAKQLGLNVKDLLGVVEKFDTFEDAAVAAAKLSQAFGANVDAIKLMRAQSPIERIDELRKGFFAAGKSADTLTRQELKLLAQSTGLSEEAARVALSQKNQSLSSTELEKKMKVAEQRHITTGQAVKELVSQIQLAIKPFKEFASFLQAFADGFSRGSLTGEKVRAMLTSIWKALQFTYRTGIEVGRVFDKIFPGIAETADAIKELFDIGTEQKPGAFRTFLQGVKSAFDDFFKDTAGNSSTSLTTLMDKLRKGFFDWFDKDGRGKKIIDSFKKFTHAMGDLVGKAVKFIAKGVSDALRVLKDLISGKGHVFDIDADSVIGTFVVPIWEAIKEAWPVVVDAFKDLWNTAWPKVMDVIEPILLKVGAISAAIIFGSAFIKAGVSVIASKAFGKIFDVLFEKIGIVKVPPKAAENLQTFSETVSGVRTIEKAGSGIDWRGIIKLAGALAVAMPILALGVVASAYALKLMPDLKVADVINFSAIAGTLALTAVALTIPAKLLSKVNFVEAFKGFGAMAVGIVAVGAAASIVLLMLKGVQKLGGIPDNAGEVIGAISSLFMTSALMVPAAIALGFAMLVPGVQIALGTGLVVFAAFTNVLIASVLPAIAMLAAVKVPDIGTFRAVTEATVSLLEAMSKFGQSISSVISTIKPGWFDDSTLESNMAVVAGFIRSMQGVVTETINDLIKLGESFVGKTEQLRIVEIVVSVISAVSSMAASLSSVISQATGGETSVAWGLFTTKGHDFLERMESIREFVSSFVMNVGASVSMMVKNLLGIKIDDPARAQENINLVSAALNVISTISNIVKSFGDIRTPDKGLSATDVNGSLLQLMGSFGPRQMSMVNDYVTGLAQAAPPQALMDTATRSMVNVKTFLDSALDAAKSMGRLNDEAATLSYYQNAAGLAQQDTPVVTAIAGMIREANAINETVSHLDSIDLKANLQKLGDRLGLSNQQFQLKQSAVNLVINLNVTMDAADVAEVVSKHGIVSTETTRR